MKNKSWQEFVISNVVVSRDLTKKVVQASKALKRRSFSKIRHQDQAANTLGYNYIISTCLAFLENRLQNSKKRNLTVSPLSPD